jgi:pimeloyl-ACP methyl ester carboxylesterase
LVKGSRLVTIEGGPHGFTWMHADEANAALLAFLADRK